MVVNQFKRETELFLYLWNTYRYLSIATELFQINDISVKIMKRSELVFRLNVIAVVVVRTQ